MALEGFFNFIFGPIVNNLSPRISVIIVAFILTLLITLVYKFFTDQKVLKAIKEEIKSLQQEMKKFKDHPEKMMQINKEIMSKNAIVMKSSFKPLFITLIPVLLIFSWLKVTFGSAGDLMNLFGWKLGWFGTYVIFSIIFSIALRKILKVH